MDNEVLVNHTFRAVDCNMPFEMEAYGVGGLKSQILVEDTVKVRHVNSQLSLEQFTLDMDHQASPECRHLLKYSQIPSFMRGNPYIHSGYRNVLSWPLCYKRY